MQPVSTRWGSQVDMAGSVLANRRVVNTSFLALNEKKYKYDDTEGSFVWALDWWDTVEKIHRLLLPPELQSLASKMTLALLPKEWSGRSGK